MRIGISGDDGFISAHLLEALGEDAVVISAESIDEDRMLDAALAGCGVLIHLNGHPPGMEASRNDPSIVPAMRDWAKKIADAKNRHQGLHLILLGSLRVHPNDPYESYTGRSSLAPRDATAEGQLWTEERCLEHATDSHPVSILRVGNVHGPSPDGQYRGFLCDFAKQAMTGWVAVPGDGEGVKDLIHINDLIDIILAVAHDPPPTREALAIGCGCNIPLSEMAGSIAEANGAEVQLWASEEDALWGNVDVHILNERLEWAPAVSIEEIIGEAMKAAADHPY